MRVLVAMSGGVDSSVAAALVRDAGHEVTGATMKLWGGPSDTGCCSVADVDDARRVAQQLGIDHFTFGFADDFELDVVAPYVAAHAEGRTPNPCIECNRHLKFDRFLRRADALGFDAIATGHHARVTVEGGRAHLRRGADRAKDQSYVLHVLRQASLRRVLLPVGELSKADVRAVAATMGLRTAGKPDSQDVCFIPSVGGRAAVLGPRLRLTPGTVVDGSGAAVGSVPAVQLVTVGQRRGLGLPGGGPPRFATAVDVRTGTVTVGSAADLLCDEVAVEGMGWVDGPVAGDVEVQVSAHGEARAARLEPAAGDAAVVHLAAPVRRVAPGQSVVVYRGDEVLGGGTAA
jgi:tRNA-specific 2-thiouridylase